GRRQYDDRSLPGTEHAGSVGWLWSVPRPRGGAIHVVGGILAPNAAEPDRHRANRPRHRLGFVRSRREFVRHSGAGGLLAGRPTRRGGEHAGVLMARRSQARYRFGGSTIGESEVRHRPRERVSSMRLRYNRFG